MSSVHELKLRLLRVHLQQGLSNQSLYIYIYICITMVFKQPAFCFNCKQPIPLKLCQFIYQQASSLLVQCCSVVLVCDRTSTISYSLFFKDTLKFKLVLIFSLRLF